MVRIKGLRIDEETKGNRRKSLWNWRGFALLVLCAVVIIWFATNECVIPNTDGLVQSLSVKETPKTTKFFSYEQTDFVPLKKIEAYMQANTYTPTVECEQCLTEKRDHLLLYSLAKHAAGPVLEEGCFCGCSTVFLAKGLQDAAKEQNRKEHPLITSDAFPVGPAAVKTPNQYREVPGQGYDLYVWESFVFAGRGPTVDGMKRDMLSIIERDGSILPCLFRTLYANGIQDMVTVVAGSSNTAPNLNYRVIFSDSAHDLQETMANEPVWSKYLFNGFPVIIAMDDVGKLPDVQRYLINKYKPTHYFARGKFFVMEVDGQPLQQE